MYKKFVIKKKQNKKHNQLVFAHVACMIPFSYVVIRYNLYQKKKKNKNRV